MEEKPTVAIVFSVLSGALIIITGLLLIRTSNDPGSGVGVNMIEGEDLTRLIPILGGINLVAGALILFGATMLNKKPESHKRYGSLILVASFMSIFGFSSGFVAVLGIFGGIFALAWSPKS